jgi:hypothetical protein
MEGQEDEKIIVQSLIGGSQLPFYLRCLKSLVTFCQDRIDLQLHTDGSLSQEDKDSIHSELDGTRVTITTPLKTRAECWIACKADQTAKS